MSIQQEISRIQRNLEEICQTTVAWSGVCFWIEDIPHHDERAGKLIASGCRWSEKRGAWYWSYHTTAPKIEAARSRRNDPYKRTGAKSSKKGKYTPVTFTGKVISKPVHSKCKTTDSVKVSFTVKPIEPIFGRKVDEITVFGYCKQGRKSGIALGDVRTFQASAESKMSQTLYMYSSNVCHA